MTRNQFRKLPVTHIRRRWKIVHRTMRVVEQIQGAPIFGMTTHRIRTNWMLMRNFRDEIDLNRIVVEVYLSRSPI